MAASARILLVEDDEAIAASLGDVLAAEGYAVEHHAEGRAAVLAGREDHHDLALVDLGLPDVDGLDVCRGLRRAQPALAIVILTARGEEMDVVLGLDAGADDYLVKPFRLSELLARLRAHLRRAPGEAPSPGAPESLRLDRGARRAWSAGREVELRPKEFDLLVLLVDNAGRVVSRDRIMREVWDENWFGSTKTLDMHITRLRRKLAPDGSPDPITTLRGVGYRLDAP